MFHIMNVFDGNHSVIEGTWSLKITQSSIPLAPNKNCRDTERLVLVGYSSWKDISYGKRNNTGMEQTPLKIERRVRSLFKHVQCAKKFTCGN